MYPLEAAELGRAGSSSGDSNCIGSLRLSTAAWLEFTGMLQGTEELLKTPCLPEQDVLPCSSFEQHQQKCIGL